MAHDGRGRAFGVVRRIQATVRYAALIATVVAIFGMPVRARAQGMVVHLGPQHVPHMPHVWSPTGEADARRRRDGSFAFQAMVDQQPVAMLFDTGASMVALRAEDARRVGIDVGSLKYALRMKTANGVGRMAPVTLGTISVGSIVLHHVRAVVAKPGALHESLLGQTFLQRLRDYRVQGDRVILHGR